MSDQSHRFPRFFVTVPTPCPYIAGEMERKLFTELRGPDANALNDTLTHYGFRRSQNVAYRPACDHCSACVSVRVRVDDFIEKPWMRRTRKRNQDLNIEVNEPWVTDEQFVLLKTYLDHRHPRGGMAEMDPYDYTVMVEDTPVDTFVTEYRLGDPPFGPGSNLIAACLSDRLSDGLSMVYSFFDPAFSRRSLGTFMILEHIARARTLGLNYVYLGYWIGDCRKMNYKSRFQPLEMLGRDGWQPDEAVKEQQAPDIRD